MSTPATASPTGPTISRTFTATVYIAHPLPAGYTEEALIDTGTSRLVGEARVDLFEVDLDETGRPKATLVSDELGELDHRGNFTATDAADAPMRRLVMQARATQTQSPDHLTPPAEPRPGPGGRH